MSGAPLTTTPADQAARDRLVHELDHTLFVEAGAGSGKTTQLVARVVELVAGGTLAAIDQLAAITFTEAAAAELRDRIRDELEARAAALPTGSVEHSRVTDAVEHLDEAMIATLHGFAFRLLSDFPIEAGLPPGFEVADEIAALVEQREQWAVFIDELFADETIEPVLARALALGLTTRMLIDLDIAFADNWDRLEHVDLPDHDLEPVDAGPLLDALGEAVDLAAVTGGGSKGVANTFDRLGPFRDRVGSVQHDPDALLDLLLHDAPEWPRFGNASKPELVAVRDKVEIARRAALQLVASARLAALEPLVARIARHTLAAAEHRRREGRIRFHDLLVLARRLLADHADVRRELASRHRVLLIDEFQDTDPLQVDLAMLLALDPPDTPVVRRDDRLDHDSLVAGEGRLFFVGDPKQSIYRFRRADIEVFERAEARFSHHGLVELVVNFRSVPSVLAFVNGTFPALMDGTRVDGRPAYRPLTAARPELVADATITLVGGQVDARSAAAIREIESRELAAAIVAMRESGRLVLPRGERQPRPVAYRDIAILIPSRVVLGELERALDRADVPFRIESRSLVFGTDQVRDLLAILQAVDDPNDQVAVVAALRSPAFACTDANLARFHDAGGRWNYRRYARGVPDDIVERLGSTDPVLAAVAVLNELHDERVWLPVNELVDRVVRRGRLVELTAAHRRPRDHWRRIRLVQDEARAFVEAGGLALADFIAHIEQQADEQAARVETVVPEADDDAVRVLTVHGSKGLEFPVVVLAGLGTEDRPLLNRVFWTDHGPELALGSMNGSRFETTGFAAVREREQRLDRDERNRLLYVAATRARDQLIVGLFHRSDKCPAARLWAASAELDDPTIARVDRFTTDSPSEAGGGAADGSVDVEIGGLADGDRDATASPGEDDLDGWRAARAALLGRVRGRVTSPTAIAATAEDREADGGRPSDGAITRPAPAPAAEAEAEAEPELAPGQPSHGHRTSSTGREPGTDAGRVGLGTAVGRAVHATLADIDLDRLLPIDQPARASVNGSLSALAAHHAAGEGIADRAHLVERLARSALESPSVAAARAAGRHWRELFVSAPLGSAGDLVEGHIDLLYETVDGDLVVVDYKTDQGHDDDALAAAAARYRWQGATYAAIVEAVLGRPVARCVFVFARSSGPAVEKVIDDLPAAIAEVEAILANVP